MSINKAEQIELISNFFPKSNLLKFWNENLTFKSIDETILSQSIEINTKGENFASNSKETLVKNVLRDCIKELKKILHKDEQRYSMKIKYFLNPECELFMIYLEKYYEYICAKFDQNLSSKYMKQKVIQEYKNKIEKSEELYEKYLEEIRKKSFDFEQKYKSRELKIASLINQQKKIIEMTNEELNNAAYDGNIKVFKKIKSRVEIEEELTKELKANELKYQKLVDENQTNRKSLIEQKLKAEQTLKAILLKFDTDIGSRVSEIESIQGDMIEENRKFEEWKSTIFAQQETKYLELMQEKEDEENRYREQKLEEIKLNHAAKVIQKGWKTHQQQKRKKAMKKNKNASKKAK